MHSKWKIQYIFDIPKSINIFLKNISALTFKFQTKNCLPVLAVDTHYFIYFNDYIVNLSHDSIKYEQRKCQK